MKRSAFIGLICCGFFFQSCEKDPPAKKVATPYQLSIPSYPYTTFPTILNIPQDNPLTVEGIALGRYLFYDGRLSGRTQPDSLMSCATCHLQEHAFEAGPNHPRLQNGRMIGLTGKATPHNMLPLFNLVFNSNGYLWTGMIHKSNTNLGSTAYNVPSVYPYHFQNIESLAWMMIAAPHECNGSIEQSVKMIASIPTYPPMFEAAFGTPEVTMERIGQAIAQFIRTMISDNSKYDQYMRGTYQFTEDEQEGYHIYMSEIGDCFHCHGGLLLTHNDYENNGLDLVPQGNDRSSVTKNPLDAGKYRAPSLRNIALTAPYMHDGRFNTLDEIIDFYSVGVQDAPTLSPLMKHGRKNPFNADQKRQLKAFLECLTDSAFITDKRFSKP